MEYFTSALGTKTRYFPPSLPISNLDCARIIRQPDNGDYTSY